MKKIWTILLAGLLIAALTAPALAWEFALNGEAEFRYRYFARQGDADLYGGPAGFAGAGVATGTIGFAGPVNNVVTPQGFSAKGSDASISDTRIWLYPEIRINEAVRLRGEYWVTGTNLRGLYDGAGAGTAYPQNSWVLPQGYSGWYIQNEGTPGNRTTPVGMSVGLWEKFWMTAQLPWGIFAVGRRPFAFGLGWSVAHEKDADSESWFLGVPYGPFTLGGYLHTRVTGNDFFQENASTKQAAVAAATGAVTPAAGPLAAGTDKNRVRQDFGPFIVYNNGPVSFGCFQEYVFWYNTHTQLGTGTANGASVPAGPLGADDFNNAALQGVFFAAAANPNTGVPIYGDIYFVLGINYFKYNNGRFFFNAEYDYEYGDIPRKGGRNISMWGQAWELEIGALCGPSKFSLAAFRSSGNDRRGGATNVNRAFGTVGATNVYDWFTEFLPFSGREQAMLPYAWLVGIYGSGTNSFDARGKPNYRDFLAYAARLDYAVAANLNIWGSYIYMNRDSNTGTAIGQYAGYAGRTGRLAQPAIAANVPDNYLGWEANVGVNWKLLEGMTFNSRFAYWQPGDWFKWAYVDFSSLGVTTVGGANYAVNPNRGIDPIIGFEGSVLVDF